MLISFGSVNVDLSVRLQRLPRAGETVLAESLQLALGGKGANQAVAAAQCSAAPTLMLATVGNDNFADFALEQLRCYGVDTSKIVRVSDSTGIALIHVDAQAENSITVVSGANARLTARACQDLLALARVLLLQLETPIAAVHELALAAQTHKVCTILDPAPARQLAPELLRAVDIITPNEGEAATVLGQADTPERMAQQLLELGARQVIIKCSQQGIVYAGELATGTMPAFSVDAIDSVAAGDAFNGALGAALAADVSFSSALRLASAAGALATTKTGAAQAMPTRADIDKLIAAQCQSSAK